MVKKILLLSFFLGTAVLAGAQSFYNFGQNRTLTVSGGIGNASYFGDLKDPREYLDPQFNLTGGLQYYFHQRFSGRLDLTYFKLEGDDRETDNPPRSVRNLSFKSSNLELALTGNFTIVPPSSLRYYQRQKVNGYLFAGIGLLYTNPTAVYNGVKYALQPLRTEDRSYSRFQVVIPFGAGERFKVSNNVKIVLEGGYRKTFTDYLDDVSTRHPNKSTWTDPVRIALSDRRPEKGLSPYEPGSIRGDPTDKDGYFLLNIKGEYYLAKNFLERRGYNQRKLYNTKRRSIYRMPRRR